MQYFNEKYNLDKDFKEKFIFSVEKDFREKNRTDTKCPICGGKLLFSEEGNSYEIYCEKENCYKITFRGI